MNFDECSCDGNIALCSCGRFSNVDDDDDDDFEYEDSDYDYDYEDYD